MFRQIAALGVVALALSGCVSPKSFFHPPSLGEAGDKGAFSVKDPRNSIVVLFTAGSPDNDTAAPCRDGGGVPPVLSALGGTVIGGKTVVVHGYCPIAIGALAGGMSMSEARAPELEDVIRSYQAQGVAARNIIIAGHSMGGWAAVLVAARKKVEIGGVIAFAPANGIWVRSRRGPNHWAAYARQKGAMEDVQKMNALVYLFHGDEFNGPEDLEFMKTVDGIQYIAVAPKSLGDGSCARNYAHSIVYSSCFQPSETDRIKAFIERL